MQLEERLGGGLPESYRTYLATQDGGALEGYNNHGIEIILGIGEAPPWSSLWYLLGQDADVIPSGCIHVGTEEGDEGVSHPVVRERLADSWHEFLSSIEPLAG